MAWLWKKWRHCGLGHFGLGHFGLGHFGLGHFRWDTLGGALGLEHFACEKRPTTCLDVLKV